MFLRFEVLRECDDFGSCEKAPRKIATAGFSGISVSSTEANMAMRVLALRYFEDLRCF